MTERREQLNQAAFEAQPEMEGFQLIEIQSVASVLSRIETEHGAATGNAGAAKACGLNANCKNGAVNNKFRLGVLGSGKGSNFAAIAAAIASGMIPAEIALVVSDVESAGILAHARSCNLPAQFIPPGKFRTKLDEEAERNYVASLQAAKADLIVLAGFMRVLKGDFLRAFEGRIVNIHPSLLPSFPGLEAWKQALDHGVKVTGCTVHFVDAGVDAGPIIGQQTVPVLDNDTPESLHQRIHAAEHGLYPKCVAAIARGEVSVVGRRVIRRNS
jgi:phosphoribosylglycinamide formyltransferase-1